MPFKKCSTRAFRCLCIVGAIAAITLVNPAFAAEKPPLAPDQDTPLVVQSRVSAVLSFSARALAEGLDRTVPRRLATFDDQLTTCGHRRGFFRRQVDIQCFVTGYIERTGPVYLRAEGNRLVDTIKLDGYVYGQCARGLARLVHGVAQGAMNVFVQPKRVLPEIGRSCSIWRRAIGGQNHQRCAFSAETSRLQSASSHKSGRRAAG